MDVRGPLRRSRRDVVLGGVLGGVAEWASLDPTVVRVAFALLSILSASFPGLLIYVVLWVVMPLDEAG